MEPADWFVRGHDHKGGSVDKSNFWQWTIQKGNYVWLPPPAAADAAIEEIRKARMKRQCSTHVIVIPKLFTHVWMKQWLKLCDLTFEIPAQHSYWSHDQYEPLTIGICFAFLPFKPWQLRSTPKMFANQRKLQKMFKDTEVDGRTILLQLLLEVRNWHTMQECMVRKMLYFLR